MKVSGEELSERLQNRKHAFPNTPGKLAACRYGCGCYIDQGKAYGPDGDPVDPLGFCPNNIKEKSDGPH